MFIIQSNQPNYCTNTFASSSCHTEYDGKVESALQAKTSLGGLSRGLRRSGSNVSELSLPERCDYDVTQVEFDFSLKSQQSIHIRVETPCGEIGTLEFNEFITEHVFRPMQHGCGNGVWKIDVLQIVDGRYVTTTNTYTFFISSTYHRCDDVASFSGFIVFYGGNLSRKLELFWELVLRCGVRASYLREIGRRQGKSWTDSAGGSLLTLKVVLE
ncbi:hypothetical protein NECAME_08275 [Necator americanus]|uniref:Uncharacterized protein n=1 Tax=Necator americanus TaxID=51031 RepID=W2TJI9_NECAM|nr:hypothetical protein NECAME_08275 [Necator americanus]ETN81973.1 hypothetical protein NECAME_08275 [Necator americanus]